MNENSVVRFLKAVIHEILTATTNRLRASILFGIVWLVALASIYRAHAGPILVFDNGGPAFSDAFVSDLAGGFQYGDDFTLNSSVFLGEIDWAGAYKGDNQLYQGSDDFSIRIFSLSGGAPGSTPLVQLNIGATAQRTLLPGTLPFNSTLVYNYDATFSPVTLSAGSYMLSIVDDTAGQPAGPWLWAWSGGGGPIWFRNADGTTWSGPYSNDMSFQLYSVPEPGIAQLALLALVFIPILNRRRPTRRLEC